MIAISQPEADHHAEIAPNPSERQKSDFYCGCSLFSEFNKLKKTQK